MTEGINRMTIKGAGSGLQTSVNHTTTETLEVEGRMGTTTEAEEEDMEAEVTAEVTEAEDAVEVMEEDTVVLMAGDTIMEEAEGMEEEGMEEEEEGVTAEITEAEEDTLATIIAGIINIIN